MPLSSVRRRVALLLAALVVLLSAVPSAAAPAEEERVAAASFSEGVQVRKAPARYHIGQLKHSVQTLNNCGPASVVSVLSYYGINVSQEAARRVLRPYAETRGMSHNVIPPYMAKYDLGAKVLVNGNADIIKALVANDIPVIVLQYISETWRTGHFRVVQGYDDYQGVFYVNDSLLGANLAISYESFDARWDYNWSRYVPVYSGEQVATVAAVLGPDWTEQGMFARTIPDLRAKVAAKPTDWTSWSRLVEALAGAERYHEALDTLENYTQRRGNFSPTNTTRLKLLNKVGRYAEALEAAETALGRSGSGSWGFGSLWLQKAEALRGLGRIAEARQAYERAILEDGTMTEARDRLASLDHGQQ
jgi:uncharacterized protein